jgi:quercetin dioxygenase-like cupin family protein
MKKTIVMMLSVVAFTALAPALTAAPQDKTEPWPGVTKTVLVDNDRVNIAEVTFAPGAVATWHSHPQYTAYATTAVKLQVEIKGQPTTVADLKKGQALWSPAVTHQTTNVGKKALTLIVTEMK